MLPEEDAVRLRHMLEAAQETLDYARGRSRADLDDDRLLGHALIHCLLVLGEAAAQVSETTRDAIPAIPWRSVVGMRNRLIHAYHDVNPDMVWKAVTENLAPLIAAIEGGLYDE